MKEAENPKIGELRYQNYLKRYSANVKSVYDERRVVATKPPTATKVLGGSLFMSAHGPASILSIRHRER